MTKYKITDSQFIRQPPLPLPCLQETLKILQNQNKFLNDEVMKLAKLRQQDAVKLQVQMNDF